MTPAPAPDTASGAVTQLDRYLIRQTGWPFVLVLACTTMVVWLTQVLSRLDLMVEDGGTLTAFLRVTVLLIPSLVGVIAPFAVLGAVLYGLNEMATENELPVIGAAGGSRMRVARPVLALGLAAGALVLAINVDLQPRSYQALKATVQEVRSDLARSLIRTGAFMEVMAGVTIYAEEVRPGDQYVGLLIHDERDAAKAYTYTAESGVFQATRLGPRLLLARGTIQEADRESGDVRVTRFGETAVDLATFEQEPGSRWVEPTERYVGELLRPDPATMRPGEGAGLYKAEGHARLSAPLYALAFGLMAAAGLLTAPVARRGYARRILAVLALAVALRTAGFLVQGAAGASPALNPLQYAVPLGAVAASAAMIAGRFWTVRRRRAPNMAALSGAPA